MRVLLPIARYDYGRPDWGDSFEYLMLVPTMEALGHDVRVIDTLDKTLNHAALQRRILEQAAEFDAELVLMMLFEDEVSPSTIGSIRRDRPVVNWFADDAWRFHAFSKPLAPSFDWIVTTSRQAFERYCSMSGVRALYSPWGFNPDVYHPAVPEPTIDVSFVGQRYGRREETIRKLSEAGHPVETWGGNWPRGRLPTSEIATVFSGSRVNLNFSESSAGPLGRRGIKFKGWFRVDKVLARVSPGPRQLKARVFEIAACRAFQLTGPAEGLDDFFDVGRELITVDSFDELRDAVTYYLEHDAERQAIADRAYARCRTSYSYATLFQRLFDEMGIG